MIIDTFPFNKDFRALEIRLSEIGDVADLIVISESNLTHSGISKPLHLSNNIKVLGKYLKKTQILTSSPPKSVTNPRIREMLQRQEISKYLKGLELSQEDLILHSDCDEIPRGEVIKKIHQEKQKGSFLLELDNYANALNLSDGKWKRLRVVSGDYFKSIQKMRQDIFLQQVFQNKHGKYSFVRIPDFWTERKYLYWIPQFVHAPKMTEIKNGGWHFNNLLTEEEVIEKIESSSHVEWVTEEVKANAIANFRAGADIYLGTPFERVEIDETYPLEIRLNIQKWEEFVR